MVSLEIQYIQLCDVDFGLYNSIKISDWNYGEGK